MPPASACLLLDFDGTLADSLGAMWAAYAGFLTRFGKIPTRAEFDSLNGPPLATVVDRLLTQHDIDVTSAVALAAYQQEIETALPQMLPTPGALEVLQTAGAAGWRIGIVTSNDSVRVQGWLDRTGLSEWIETIVGGDVRPGKPDPAPYLTALDRLGGTAALSLAVEDSAQGYAAATGAGIETIFYRPLNRPAAPTAARTAAAFSTVTARLNGRQPEATVRLATAEDLPFLHSLRNDPSAVSNFRTARQLTQAELATRFTADPTLTERIILIAEVENRSAAMVRFDRETNGAYLVSIIVDRDHRGRGLGLVILRAAVDALLAMHGPVPVVAEVARMNPASAHVFGAAGFSETPDGDARFQKFRRDPLPSAATDRLGLP